MESDTTGCQSHLLNSMRSYLCNPKRAQPIIGLDSILELCTNAEPQVFMCDVCILKINKTDIKSHIMGSLHRYNYIRSCHVSGLRAGADLTSLAWHLIELAKFVERKEGPGNVQVLELEEDVYMEMMAQPVPDVLAQVKEIKKQALINEVQSTACNKIRKSDDHSVPIPAAERSSPVRTMIQSRGPPRYPFLPEFPAPSSSPELSDFMHEDEMMDKSRVIDTCVDTESHVSNPVQTAKCKHVAHCQNSSLTRTITQQTSQENISSEEISQKVNHILKLIRTQGASEMVTATALQDQYQLENDPSNTEAFSNSDWMLNSSNVEQVEEQPLSLTPEDTYFRFECTSPGYPITSSESVQQQDQLETCDVQSLNFSEESPETYTGTQPLIGLQTVIKCQSVDGDPPPFCYLCQSCSLKVLRSDIIQHLINPQHYFNYINFYHHPLLVGITGEQSLQIIAMQLEQHGGRGQMKVTRLSACLFSEVLERDYHWCMKMLNCGSTEVNKPLMEGPSDHSATNKLTNESAQISLAYGGAGSLPEPSGKLLVHQHKSNKKKARRKNAGHIIKPVFKVSLSLKGGPVVVDRTSLITATTVAPEIELQDLQEMYPENVTVSAKEYMTSGIHVLPEEHTEQNLETFYNRELSDNQHLHPEETDTQTLGYADAEIGAHTYGYMNNRQFLHPVEYIEPFFSGNMNSHPGPVTNCGPVDHDTCVKQVSCPTTFNGCPATYSESDWVTGRQPVRNKACNWPAERGPVMPSHANNCCMDNPMFVWSEWPQTVYGNQVPHQMLERRNDEVVNFSRHTYPAEVGDYDPYYPKM